MTLFLMLGAGKCVAQGVQTVVIAPYFLSRGRHIQEDIPQLVREAQEKHTGVSCIVADPIGEWSGRAGLPSLATVS